MLKMPLRKGDFLVLQARSVGQDPKEVAEGARWPVLEG